VTDKRRCINKIGHALHDLDPVFRKFTLQPLIVASLKSLGMKDPVIPQSMYIFKQPYIGGFVSIHQDSTFMNPKPLTCKALWFALEDVTLDNGCLWVVPGSHKEGITSRFKLNHNRDGTVMADPDPEEAAPYKSLDEVYNKKQYPEKWVPLPCKKGSVVVIHGSVVHMSERNTSPHSRHVYTFHLVERDAVYSPENWLQYPPDIKFKGFDPSEYS